MGRVYVFSLGQPDSPQTVLYPFLGPKISKAFPAFMIGWLAPYHLPFPYKAEYPCLPARDLVLKLQFAPFCRVFFWCLIVFGGPGIFLADFQRSPSTTHLRIQCSLHCLGTPPWQGWEQGGVFNYARSPSRGGSCPSVSSFLPKRLSFPSDCTYAMYRLLNFHYKAFYFKS